MIRPISDMPAGVLGFEAVGDIETDDYANVMVPAVEDAIEQHGKVRIVYMLGPEFEEYEAGAKWEDVKLGARHPASFEDMAVPMATARPRRSRTSEEPRSFQRPTVVTDHSCEDAEQGRGSRHRESEASSLVGGATPARQV